MEYEDWWNDIMTDDNCEDSTELELIAVYYSFGAGKENGAVTMRKEVGHADYREPLVRLSDVQERVEDLWQNEESLHRAFIKLRKELNAEEFTQNGREDIVECSECGMRQYRENWDDECLKCGADVSQKGESSE